MQGGIQRWIPPCLGTRQVGKHPRFAVVGTGRCGTGYVSRVLRACGVNCGHENWWTVDPRRRRGDLDGDASWMALPDIEAGVWSGPVAHIIRHPVDVVASLMGIGFFAGRARCEYVDFAYLHEPDLVDLDPVQASVEWWARWNARCLSVADVVVRVEEFTGRLRRVSDAIGRDLDESHAARVPVDVNHRARAPVSDANVWRLLDGRDTYGYRESRCA